MIPILFTLELTVGGPLVHEGLRGHRSALGADQVAIPPIHDEFALIIVATNFALMKLQNKKDSGEKGGIERMVWYISFAGCCCARIPVKISWYPTKWC